MKTFVILLAILISTAFSISHAKSTSDPFVKGQIWQGWYDCGEGKTKLKLTITEASSSNASSSKRQSVSAIYDFTTLKGVNGAFNTIGRFRSGTQKAIFMPKSWIKKPPGYAKVKFQGVISDDGKEFSGKIIYRGCKNFRLFSPDSDFSSNPSKYDTPKTVNSEKNKNQAPGFEELLVKHNQQSKAQKNTKVAVNSHAKSSYRFEQNRPPSRGSHSVYMHFDTLKDLAIVSNEIDDIVKADLMKRAQQSGNTRRLGGQYNFFVNGKEIEWRRYKYNNNKGWGPVIGVALEVVKKRKNSSRRQKVKETFTHSIINQASTLANSPTELASLFNLGFSETGSIPTAYKFEETNKRPTSSEKWYKKKKFIMKGVSYSIEVKVDNFERLIEDRENLARYAKLDLIKRVGKEQFDKISGFYWFKSDAKNKRYVHVNLHKRAGGGFHERITLALLDTLATGSEANFLKRYRMSKAMFIAEQNGNKEKINALKNSRIADVESMLPSNSVELEIASKLNKVQKLPILYINESRKWDLIGGFSRQEITRKAVDKYGFPMNAPLSSKQIITKKRELVQLIEDLGSKGKQFEKSAPRVKIGYSSIVKLPTHQQKQLSEQVLYPAIMEIQSKTIELLSRIPRTVKGLDEAFEINKWLFSVENDYRGHWNKLMEASSNPGGGAWQPNALCENISTRQQLALGPKTGRCFFEVTYSSRLLRDVWRIQYMRKIDKLISQKIEKNGADLYRKAFLLAYDLRGQDFDYHAQSKFANFNASLARSNERCLFENCSSQLTKLLFSEYSGKQLSNEKKNNYLTSLENKSKELLNRWTASSGQSKRDRYSIQSDIISYSREVAKNILIKLSNSAAKELGTIGKNDTKAYKNWHTKTAKPIRKLAVVWKELWDIGFGLGRKESALSALGLQNEQTRYIQAAGGSPFVDIAEILYDAQYKWVTKSEKGTSADATVKFPTGWSSSGNYQQPKRPRRHYAQLMTPPELFFESIGHHIGQASSALVSYGSQIAQLQNKITKSRKAFFKCLPNCKELQTKRAIYSKALIEKDIYFLEISGRSGSLVNKGSQNMSTVMEAMTGSRGFTLVDGGIPKVCYGYFDKWLSKFGETHGQDGTTEIDAMFGAIRKMTTGDFSGLKEQGFKLIQKQQEAFAKSATEYRKYQVCRDQYEFDRYEK